MLINVMLIKECVFSSHGETMVVDGRNKLLDILIVATKYSKLRLEVKLLLLIALCCYISCYIVLQLLVIILYLLRYQSGGACV